MKSTHLRRKQLDELLARQVEVVPRPHGGWLRAIRESLGMTLDGFGKRLGVTRATAHQIEKAEVNESITIKRLRAAAAALECDLVVTIVPRQSLDQVVHDRAYRVARQDVEWVNHSMALESQALYDEAKESLVEETAQRLIERNDPRIWTSD